MKHEMKLHNEPFNSIKSKRKDIELRLYDEKRRLLSIGDFIEFTNTETKEKIEVEIINLHIFKSFYELYSKFNKVRLGYKENEFEDPKDMEMYYSKENIEKYGVVGIEVKIV